MNQVYHVGIGSSFHDPSIAIISPDGEVLFAEGSERHLQDKRAIGAIPDNIHWAQTLINTYCKDPGDFHISTSWENRFVRQVLRRERMGILKVQQYVLDKIMSKLDYSIYPDFQTRWFQMLNTTSNLHAGMGFEKAINQYRPESKIFRSPVNHHDSHAALACYTSSFDEALCLVMDGSGEWGTYSVYHYTGNKILPVFAHKGYASMGFFYGLITRLCGFDPNKGEQWKVMGLAPYGKKNEEIYQLLSELVRIKGFKMTYSSPFHWANILKALEKYYRNPFRPSEEAADLAYTGQLVFAEIMEEMLNSLHKLGISDNLIYTGGIALNSSFNGRILEFSRFKNLYIPSAPGDDGNGLGAALYSYYKENPSPVSMHQELEPYLGSEIQLSENNALFKHGKLSSIRHLPDSIFRETARLLAQGKLVGWVQGRAEFGPRALGNRSILADPRSPYMKDKINARVKLREPFRPFAPSILHEYGEEYFRDYQDSPFMERTLRYQKEAKKIVPAVVHANNTGRLQSVTERRNPDFYRLIKEFHAITGVPVLLNTSFNIMGKPIIHSLQDAISMFFTSGLDVLVIGDYLIEKSPAQMPEKALAV